MRKRLTAKKFLAESQADGLFPGDVGNMERSKNYHDVGEYDNYDWQEGWDLPTKGEFKDEREAANFGARKEAQRRAFLMAKSKKSSILAQLLLGDSAPDSTIRAQAKEFMKLSYQGLCDSIARFKATEDAPEVEEDKKEDAAEADKTEEADATKEACGNVTGQEEAPKAEDTAEADKTAGEETVEEVETAKAEEAEDKAEDGEGKEEGIIDANCELVQGSPDPELEAIFDEEYNGVKAPETADADKEGGCVCTTKTAKKGIKHIAAQPKLASTDTFNLNELEGLWDDIKLPHI